MSDDCCGLPEHTGARRKRRSLPARALNWLQSAPRWAYFALTADLPKASLYSKRGQDAPWHRPLENPEWRNLGRAEHMRDDDPVLGLHLFGGSWAIPWWIHKNHHVGNLELNGRFVLVTLCEACSGASAFDPVVNGQRLRFHPVGHYNGTILTSDYQTGSYWSPFTGLCLSGKLKGEVLPRYPLTQCNWGVWKDLHPDTLVPWAEQGMREGHGAGHVPGAGHVGPGFANTLEHPIDERLPVPEMVLGVQNAGISRAYRMSTLTEAGPVLHDRLGGLDIVILHVPETFHALAFAAELDGQPLRLQQADNAGIVDPATGSRWSYDGECFEGQLKGRQLSFVTSWAEEWYGWAAYHPDTEVYTPA